MKTARNDATSVKDKPPKRRKAAKTGHCSECSASAPCKACA